MLVDCLLESVHTSLTTIIKLPVHFVAETVVYLQIAAKTYSNKNGISDFTYEYFFYLYPICI